MDANRSNEPARPFNAEADRMQERLDDLGRHIEDAEDKAESIRERDSGTGGIEPGEPLAPFLDGYDVAPGDGGTR